MLSSEAKVGKQYRIAGERLGTMKDLEIRITKVSIKVDSVV